MTLDSAGTVVPVHCSITVSTDGFVAGPDQRRDEPLGTGGEALHRWMFEEPEAHAEAIAEIQGASAYVMGRHMFAGAGEWSPDWRGWWGEEPPYHCPVFVLTSTPREPLAMDGGTTFFFVDTLDAALTGAAHAAAAADGYVGVAGGAQTINQCLERGVIDELWLHRAPVLLGSGERLFAGVGPRELTPVPSPAPTALVSHQRFRLT